MLQGFRMIFVFPLGWRHRLWSPFPRLVKACSRNAGFRPVPYEVIILRTYPLLHLVCNTLHTILFLDDENFQLTAACLLSRIVASLFVIVADIMPQWPSDFSSIMKAARLYGILIWTKHVYKFSVIRCLSGYHWLVLQCRLQNATNSVIT